jgi:hypothetical protein
MHKAYMTSRPQNKVCAVTERKDRRLAPAANVAHATLV